MTGAIARRGQGLRRLVREPALLVTVLILGALIVLFILFPLVTLLARTFVDVDGFTLEPLLEVLREPYHRRAFTNSLLLAALVGLCGTALGFLFAFTAARARLSRRWLTVLDVTTLLPLISPPFIMSIAVIFSVGPRGLITYDLLGIKTFSAYGLHTTLFVETLTYFPIAYLTLRPILATMDANVEDMALSLGDSRWGVFRSVTLPLAVPGFANAFLLLFAASLADFATPLILAGSSFPVLPVQAFLQITGMFDLRGGAALSFLLLVPAVSVFLLQRYWVSRRYYVTVTGKVGPATTIKTVAPWVRPVLVGACAMVGVVILYLYLLLFYASVVVAFGANYTLTLDHYVVVFTDGLNAIVDTLIIAGAGMPLGGIFGVLVGYLVVRKVFPGRKTMEMTSMINYALPGTTVGIAYLIAFNTGPIVLTGTAVILIACYAFRYSPTGIRATVALLQQIDPSIEEASQSLGARATTTFRRITLPLIVPAFFAGLGVVFIRSMTAISATIFLVSISWTLITVRILENITELSLGPAAAFSVLVVAIVLAVLAVISMALRRFRSPGHTAMSSMFGG